MMNCTCTSGDGKTNLMKHLLTLTALLISSLAMGQFPNLPYNPDDNGDGLIGVVDLQGLLANYGNEFTSAVVSEDGESAIVYMGNSQQIQCKYDCAHLPGHWHLPEPYELVPVLNEIAWVNGTGCQYAWITDYGKEVTGSTNFYKACDYQGALNISSAGFNDFARCYCAAKQLPRVEYFTCKASCSDGYVALDACVNEKLAEGWYPWQSQRQQQVYNDCFWQPLWRWAE